MLRAVASLAVVLHHAIRAVFRAAPDGAVALSSWQHQGVEVLAAGVDLFFVLSGFLMVHIAGPYVAGRRGVGDFLAHRLIRIWPVYAIATTASLLLLTRHAGGLPVFDLRPERLLSYVFIPSFNEAGVLQPIIGVGWTLNYEVFFYLVFALALCIRRIPLALSLPGLLLAALVMARLVDNGSALTRFAGDPILIEFLIGGAVALAYRAGRLARLPAVPTLLAGALLLLAFAEVPNHSPLRFLSRGVPAAILFIGMLRLGDSDTVRWPRLALLLGNASYSIYLLHILVIYEMLYWTRAVFERVGMLDYWVVAAVPGLALASIGVGLAFYLAVERPLLALLRARLRAPAPAKVTAEA